MDIDASPGWDGEDREREDLAISHDHDEVGLERSQNL
jgi:hypothetical protein